VTLSVLGGAIGMIVAVAACQRRFGSLEPHLSAGTVALAFGSSVLIGVVFGAYPARRAARLTPSEAFRSQ
jgi:putative ABC transport system permease protein